MGNRNGGPQPLEPVALQVQLAQRRRDDREWVARAEHVAHKPRLGQFSALDRASRCLLLLQNDNLPTVLGQDVGGDKTVWARSDDHGIYVAGHRAELPVAIGQDTLEMRLVE